MVPGRNQKITKWAVKFIMSSGERVLYGHYDIDDEAAANTAISTLKSAKSAGTWVSITTTEMKKVYTDNTYTDMENGELVSEYYGGDIVTIMKNKVNLTR